MTNLQVVTWPAEKLIPYARNARTHSDDQVAQSLERAIGIILGQERAQINSRRRRTRQRIRQYQRAGVVF